MTGPRGPLLFLLLAAAARAEDAGKLFEARCAACHTIPDRDLRGDRAWIGQVQGTA